MKEIKTFSKIIMYVCTLSGILWLGSYVARLTLIYQLFEGNNFTLKEYLSSQNLPGIFITLNAATILTSILYAIFIVSLIIFLITSRISLKENGWLLILTLIIFITCPFEIFLMTFDYKIFKIVESGLINSNELINFSIERLKALGSFPIIEILCYFAVIFLVLFKPLKKFKQQVHES